MPGELDRITDVTSENTELPQEIEMIAQEGSRPVKAVKDEDEMPLKPRMQDPDDLFRQLTESIKRYHPSDDMSLIRIAYELAREAHKDQKRHSGEPYIIHPLHVALILSELEMDKESIISGLLHDVVEDTDVSIDIIRFHLIHLDECHLANSVFAGCQYKCKSRKHSDLGLPK